MTISSKEIDLPCRSTFTQGSNLYSDALQYHKHLDKLETLE